MSIPDPEIVARSLAQAGRHVALCRRHLGPMVHQALPGASAAWDDLNLVAMALGRAGVAVDAEGVPDPPPADSLEALRRIEQSRTEGLALLSALATLLPIAEALDKARGNWVGDMARTDLGETPGTNYAEMIQELHLGLRQELHGAKGSGRE